jgi:hypothetical protein
VFEQPRRVPPWPSALLWGARCSWGWGWGSGERERETRGSSRPLRSTHPYTRLCRGCVIKRRGGRLGGAAPPWPRALLAESMGRIVSAGSFRRGFVWTVTPPKAVITRWSTTLSLKVNLPHAIDFRGLCGANLAPPSPPLAPRAPTDGKDLYEMSFNSKLSGHEVYYTMFLYYL